MLRRRAVPALVRFKSRHVAHPGRKPRCAGAASRRDTLKSRQSTVLDAPSVLGMAYATGGAGIPIDIPLARQMLTQAAEIGGRQSARHHGQGRGNVQKSQEG